MKNLMQKSVSIKYLSVLPEAMVLSLPHHWTYQPKKELYLMLNRILYLE